MDSRRHPQLAKRLGIKSPELLRLPPLAASQQKPQPGPKPPPLADWHYDPQLFRKWPQVAGVGRGAAEESQGLELVNEVSVGI
jgi:hypothetical protein